MNLSTIRAPKKSTEKRSESGAAWVPAWQDFDARPQGQWSRTGARLIRGFEGGQMPLHRRIPKRGFTNIFREEYDVVNLDRLASLGETEITPETLKKAGVVNGKSPVKILGNGELKIAITVHAHKFSKTAQDKITKAGGKFEVLQ